MVFRFRSLFVGGGFAVEACPSRDGTFKAPTQLAGAAGSMGAYPLDLDKHGVLDLLVNDYSSGTVNYDRGKGDGTFGATALLTTFNSTQYGFSYGDLNKDGKLDVFGGSFGTNLVYWSLNTSQ